MPGLYLLWISHQVPCWPNERTIGVSNQGRLKASIAMVGTRGQVEGFSSLSESSRGWEKRLLTEVVMVPGGDLCTHCGLLCQDRETEAPRAMRVVTTAVKTTEESTKGIRDMSFIKVLCFQLRLESQNCGKTPLKKFTPVDSQKLLTSLTILP